MATNLGAILSDLMSNSFDVQVCYFDGCCFVHSLPYIWCCW